MPDVYKYLAPERSHALQDATLRATQSSALNDPFELKPYFKSVIRRSDLELEVAKNSFIEKHMKEAYAKRPRAERRRISWQTFVKLANSPEFKPILESQLSEQMDQLEKHLPDLADMARRLVHQKLGDHVGIVSLSEVSNNGLMWAHYANDHKGFVISFDETHPFFDQRRTAKDEFYHLRPVEYQDSPLGFEMMTDLDGAKLLCGKQSIWSYEREKRLLIPINPNIDNATQEPIHLIHFPRSAVREVILGHRASNELQAEIRRIIGSHPEYRDVTLLRARADISTGTIVIESLP